MARRLGLLLALAAVLAVGGSAAPAGATIWWQSYDGNKSRIGRAANDGTAPNGAFVTDINNGSGAASNGSHVYWGSLAGIGRATTTGDGSDAEKSFMPTGTFCGTFDVAATATHVYWLSSDCQSARYIGHGTTGGQYLDRLLPNVGFACGIGIDGTYIYWGHGNHVGRALLNGQNPDPTWLDVGTGNQVCDVAADATHVYYTFQAYSAPSTTIGRASIDGSEASVMNNWVATAPYAGDQSLPPAIAVDDDYVYWNAKPWETSAGGVGSIGRAPKAGGGAQSAFIQNVFVPTGLAVDATGAGAADADADGDGVPDADDNCAEAANADQADNEGDGIGNVCDADDDNDNAADGADNCPTLANASQADGDGDGAGDTCDPDDDGDGVHDASDNCPLVPNGDQRDDDRDGRGRACDDNDVAPPPPPMRVVAVSTTNNRFAVGSGSTPVRGVAAAVARGTTFVYELNQPAEATLDILRRNAGRRVKGACRKATRKRRSAPRCDLRVARLFRTSHAGRNTVAFTGRIRGKALAPGRHVMIVRAAGDGGSDRARVAFRIVRAG